MWQHINGKPIWLKFKTWYRCALKTDYIYKLDIYTRKKVTTEFSSGELVAFQLTAKLSGSFCYIFFENGKVIPFMGSD